MRLDCLRALRFRKQARRVTLLAMTAIWLCHQRVAECEVRESFESPQVSWRFAESDCRLQIEVHQRVFGVARSGEGCEYLRYLAAVGGTQALFTHSVDPARVIDELTPSVWVKADRPGLQLSARVVLPRSLDRDGRPVTGLLPGDSYTTAGQWQQLRVEDLRRLLQRQVRLLRASPESVAVVDDAEAYIDMVVLNGYAGRGMTELWLDDLEVTGFAAAPSLAAERRSLGPAAEANVGGGTDAESRPSVRGPHFRLGNRPIAVRAIEWQGEPFSFLAGLGFNAVRLSGLPTEDQVTEAEREGLWIIAPPPPDAADQAASAFRRHLCWAVGENLTSRDVASVSEEVGALRRSAAHLERPVLCSIEQGLQHFAGTADVLLLNWEPIGTSTQLSGGMDWLQTQSGLVRPAKPLWVTIQTEFSESLRYQLGSLAGGRLEAVDVEPAQIWLQVTAAAAGGMRGFVYRSGSRLDADGESARRRSAALQVANQYLLTMDPWIAAGRPGGEIELRNPDFRAAMLQTDRSRLLIVMSSNADQQFVVGTETPPTPLKIPVANRTDNVYRVTSSGAEPLAQAIGRGSVELHEPGLVSLIVFTAEPLVEHHLKRRTDAMRRDTIRREVELATATWQETDTVLRQLAGSHRLNPETADQMARVQSELERLRHALHAGDMITTSRGLARVNQQTRRIRKEYWHAASSGFPTPESSPLCTSFRTLPAHWHMVRRMSGAKWGPNEMAAGGAENLSHMLAARWIQHQSSMPNVHAKAELSLESPRSGRYSLKLQASSGSPPALLEQWPVWITSAPVPVQAGQLMKISGSAKVPEQLAASVDGLLIFDTMTGVEQATRFHSTRGWNDFELFRVAPSSGEVMVVIALTGLGSAFVDDLQLSLLQP